MSRTILQNIKTVIYRDFRKKYGKQPVITQHLLAITQNKNIYNFILTCQYINIIK